MTNETNEQLIDDLNYASKLAKSGQNAPNAPLVGGPIGLMWGLLLSTTLVLHWAIVSQTLALPFNTLWYIWIGFSVLGGLATATLSKTIQNKPATCSTANKIEQNVWMQLSIMLGCLWIGILLSMATGNGTPQLFDLMVIVAFGGQGLAYGLTAKMSHNKWLVYPATAAFLASIVSVYFYGQSQLYLYAGVATLFTVVFPSIKTMALENAK